MSHDLPADIDEVICDPATYANEELFHASFAQLRAHFSEGDILELGTAMAIISGMAKLSFVLGVVDKEPYCPFAATAAAA